MSYPSLELEDLRDAADIVYSSLYSIFPYAKAPLEYKKAQNDLNDLILNEGKQLVKDCDDYRLKTLKTLIIGLNLSEIYSNIDLDTLRDILEEMSSSQNKEKNEELRLEAAQRIFNTLMQEAIDIDVQSFRADIKKEIAKLKVDLEKKNVEEGYTDLDLKDEIDNLEYQDYLLQEIETTLNNPNDPNANSTLKNAIENTRNTIMNRIGALNYVCPSNGPEFYQLVHEALEKMFKTKEWLYSSPTFKMNMIDSLQIELDDYPQIVQLLNNTKANVNAIIANRIKSNSNLTTPIFEDDDDYLYNDDYIRYNYPNEYIPQDEFGAGPKM